MSREEYLRNQILSHGTMKDFAIHIDMPYSTLLSILKNVGGAAIDNVFKICHGLNLKADVLDGFAEPPQPILTPDEESLLDNYRQLDAEDQGEVRGYVKGILRSYEGAEEKDA